MDYLLHIFIFFCISLVLTASLDLLVGETGLLSLAHAAFYGIGAYVSALLAVRLGAWSVVGLLMGMATAALISFVVSLPSLRLRDDYFVVATFAFQIIFFSVFNNWMDLTKGPLGIAGIPPVGLLGITIRSNVGFAVLAFIVASLAFAIVRVLASSPFGRVLRAIREDELFTQSLGKATLRYKITVFAIGAALAASAGSLYAHYITYIDPSSFTVTESILVLSMVIIGGAGSRWGALVGAALLVTLPEVLRFVGLPSAVAANLRQIIYGALLVIVMMFRPRGLLGRYGFGR